MSRVELALYFIALLSVYALCVFLIVRGPNKKNKKNIDN